MLRHNFIGNFYQLSAYVNSESISVGILNNLQVVIIQNVMRVGEPFLATIRPHKCINHQRIDVT